MTRPKLDIDDFYAQFHNHEHYQHYEPGEHRPEWWELGRPTRATGGPVFRASAKDGKTTHPATGKSIVDRALQLVASKGATR